MKKTILLFVFILLVNSVFGQTNWLNKTTYNVKEYKDFSDLTFINELTGFTYTINPNRIYKTTDAGISWFSINLPEGDIFFSRNVFFKDANTIYLLNFNKFYRTYNSGNSWDLVYTFPETAMGPYVNPNIYFKDALTGYVNNSSSIFKTTNGGISWDLLSYPAGTFEQSNYYVNENKFFSYCGEPFHTNQDKLLRTENGGQSWTTVLDMNNYDHSLTWALKFANENVGVLVTGKNYTLNNEVLGKTATNLFITNDGGNTWTRKILNVIDFQNINISPDASIDIVSGDGYHWYSNNGGDSFVKTYYNAKLTNIIKVNNSPIKYMGGRYNAFYRSQDAGSQFSDISSSSSSHTDLYSISFLNDNTGFAVGERGTIIKTVNGGESFSRVTNQNGTFSDQINYHYVNFFDENNGVIAGDYALRKTSDGGNSWTDIALPVSIQPTSNIKTVFRDKDHGIIRLVPQPFGNGKVYYTSNGGSTWRKIAEDYSRGENYYPHQYDQYQYINFLLTTDKIYLITYHYSSSNFGSEYSYPLSSCGVNDTTFNFGFAVGRNVTALSFIKSVDEQIVYYANDAQWQIKALNYTVNNGNDWVYGDQGVMHKYAFGVGNNTYYGLAGGPNGNEVYPSESGVLGYRVQKSPDVGQRWYNSDSINSFGPRQLYFIDNSVGFIIGNGGMIIKTINGGNVGVGNIITSLPDKFNLEQNYPNPFNPITKINFSIPAATRISVKVYDMLGKEVAVLINSGLRNAGSYSINFDGSKLSSGVYFYKLINEDNSGFSITKKMMLIK